MSDKKRFVYVTAPEAVKENMVSGDKFRFTVLTPQLLRLEYSLDGVFEDRASQTVFFRNFEKNNFSHSENNGILTIETDNLFLRYNVNKPFSHDTLKIRLKTEPACEWRFGDYFEDLGGTAKTLDEADGAIDLERGIISRNGFSVLDDSDKMLLNNNGWVEARHKNTLDLYFFGYGFEYKKAIKDYYKLTGFPPMLPAYALGNWWSRYYAYTQEEYENLVLRFEKENVPFSVGVIDMDWHLTKIPENEKDHDPLFPDSYSGWTGYTWNKELFPDYKAFLKFLKDHGLKTSLNLHPAGGVCSYEEMYKEMALKCGVDPKSGKRVYFDILSEKFMENYFDVLHHPYEEDGVDFWWMDWQQGTSYWWIHEENKDGKLKDEREVLDPLWMLNHLHIADIKRNGKRPMFFSRFSGPGSQRYPVGFSGDTFVTWESLDFQPYFTSTASNIGYSWWSHDIGGHGDGYRDDNLMIRWVQFGVFSPINRLHSTCNDFIRKEPWCFKGESEEIIKSYLRLRHRLFPYIYTMNYRTHKLGLPLISPMYYDYPKNSGAYECKNQYMFGDSLMIAPITSPDNKITELGGTEVWFPEGDCFDFFKGTHYRSLKPRKLKVYRKISEYPAFAKAGAIIPMNNSYKLSNDGSLDIVVFPLKSNSFSLYEDGGDGNEFENGCFAQTEFELNWSNSPEFIIHPALGDTSLLPENRNYNVRFRGFCENTSVKAFINDKAVETECSYSENTLTVSLSTSVKDKVVIKLTGDNLVTDNGDLVERCTEILQKSQCDIKSKIAAMNLIKRENFPKSYLIKALSHALANGREYADLIGAVKEQLLLTEE